jgi:hypothetical protein
LFELVYEIVEELSLGVAWEFHGKEEVQQSACTAGTTDLGNIQRL